MKRATATPFAIPIGIAGMLIALVFTWKITLPAPSYEPLADPISLRHLMNREPLSRPAEETHAEFHGVTTTVPRLPDLSYVANVLGFPSKEKHIEVDLTNQRVYAYEGSKKVMEFVVSTGLWGWTPTGEFTIWTKVRSQLMSGGNKEWGTYYYLPNVPYVMFFYNDEVAKMRGFSFHGTYWHDNFGHPMSHGCINMRTEEAQMLYDWATPIVTDHKAWSTLASADNPGTKVIIYGETPVE